MQRIILFLCVNAFLFTVVIFNHHFTNAWGVRGRASSVSVMCGSVSVSCQGYVPGEVSTAGETAFAPLGCPCALVGQKCGPASSQCIGPNGDRKGGIGTGTPKRGTCGCRSGWTMNCTTQQCLPPSTSPATCSLSVSTSSVTVGNCVAAFGTIPGITVTASGCTTPLQFLIAASNSADKTPYINIDPYTLAVFANNLLPTSSIRTQTYYVAAIDEVGLISNQISFTAVINPANTTTSCSC
jgi:hypothetical protein